MGENLANGREKSHVEHLVGFVEDEDLQVRQVDSFLGDVVEKTPWAGDNDIHSFFQRLRLRMVAYPTIDRDAADADAAPQSEDRLVNLLRQLTGRCDNQSAQLTALALHETMQDRQHESGCFAGAGLRQPHDVAPLHDGRNRLRLNWSGHGVCRLR